VAALDDVYQDRLLALADPIERDGHVVEAPSFTARAVSRACGSSVEIQVRLDGDRVADYGQKVDACALGSAAASVMGRAVIGATLDEIVDAGAALEAMLKRGGPPPVGRFAELAALEPARAFRNRHASILLTFTAFRKGLKALAAP